MDSDINENLPDNLSLKVWLCKNNHRLMDCPSFKNKSIFERRHSVKENKLCFNCLSKTHIVKDCKSSFICREQNCDKEHHTLLYEPPNVNLNNNLISDLCTENEYLQKEVSHLENIEHLSRPQLSCNKINKNPQQNNTTTYLQVLPLTVSYEDKELSVNALLDSGSDSTVISKSLADYLNLSGQEKEIQFSNAVSSTTKIKSKLVTFSISSGSHPGKINVKNAWIVENLNLPPNKIDNAEIKDKWPHLKDLNLDFSNTRDISILIGADMPTLHIDQEIRKGKPNEPITIKTILGWVLMGGKSEKISQSCNFKQVELTKPRYPIRVCRAFLGIRNIWYTSKADLTLLLKNEQKAIKVLEVTVEKTTDDHYSVGLLWKEHRPILPFNRDLAIMRLKFLENQFKRDPEFYKSYKNTVKD